MDTKQPVFKSPLAVLGGLVGLGLIVAAFIGAYVFYRVQIYGGSLSVTGSAKTRVVSDQAKWTFHITKQVTASGMKQGYDSLASDLSRVNEYLKANKVAENSIVISAVSVDEMYRYDKDGQAREKEYNLRQTITVSSNDVDALSNVAKGTGELAKNGVIIQTYGVEYLYSKLPELRVSLLSEAIKDAKARATKLAEPSGQTVGPLRSASLGVVQVLAPNSLDVSDYGSYDTSSKEKEVMVTVRAAFSIR